MAKKYLLATLNNMTSIPNGSIYRGVELDDPVFDDKFNQVFKKKGLKVEGRIDKLKKVK